MSGLTSKPIAVALAAIVLATAGTAIATPADAGPGKKFARSGDGGDKRFDKRKTGGRKVATTGSRYVKRTAYGSKTVIFNRDGSKTIVKMDRTGRVIGRKTVRGKNQARARLSDRKGTVEVVKNGKKTTVIKRDRKGKEISRQDVRQHKRGRYTLRTVHGTKTVIDNRNGTKTVILRSKSGKVTSAYTVPMRGGRRIKARSTYNGVTTTVLRKADGGYKVTKAKMKAAK